METSLIRLNRQVAITGTSSQELWTELSKIDIPPEMSLIEMREIECPSISSLIIKMGMVPDRAECFKFFKMMIILINEFFGISWTDYQLQEVSREFYSCFHHWKIVDAKNFMQRCRRLYYGKLYGAFSPATLMEWAQGYNEEWISVSQQITHSKHLAAKQSGERDTSEKFRDQIDGGRQLSAIYDRYQKSHPEFKQEKTPSGGQDIAGNPA